MVPVSRRLVVAGGACLLATGVAAAPRARLADPRWGRFGAGAGPDHGAWDAVLKRGLSRGPDGVARFDYAGADRGAVSAYVTALGATDPTTLSAPAAFAYWVNAYNAVTVKTVLEHWPVGSIRDIGGGLFSRGPWKEKRFRAAGTDLSLDDIEHGILRPVWRDPRVHYALNCASLGCPDLAPRAYRAKGLGRMLDAAARAYIAHPRGVEVTAKGRLMSSIYDWFAADFGGEAGVAAHLLAFADPAKAAALRASPGIAGYRYDWSINAA